MWLHQEGIVIMAQQRRSFGCLQKLDKKVYRIRWTDGGRRRSETIHGSRAQAERRLSEIHAASDPRKRHVQRIGDIYAALVLPEYRRTSAPRTLANIESCYNKYIAPQWGSQYADDLRPADFQAWLLTLPRESAKKSLAIMRAIFRHAVMLEMIPHSPLDMPYSLPTTKTKDISHDILHAADIDAYYAAVCGSFAEAAFILGACAGLRPGEMLGVRLEDVEPCDLGAVVEVCRQVDDNGCIVTNADGTERTKTASSRRYAVVLEPYAARLLDLCHDAERSGAVYLMDDGTGNPIGKSALRREWSRVLDSAGLPMVLLRNLRPTFATNAHHELGMQTEDIARLLGHTKPIITYATYERPDKDNILNMVRNSIQTSGK